MTANKVSESHPQQPQGVAMSKREPQRLMQTELGPYGNCQSACLAMMLGLPLSAVPNFWAIGGGASDGFVRAQREWLEKRGLFILTFSSWGQEGAVLFPPQHGYFIVGGTSPRGHPHSVIFKDGALWHDPHPEGGGIVPDSVDFIFPIGFPALAALPSPVAEDASEHLRAYLDPAYVNDTSPLHLATLLKQRDDFIVAKGLWLDFTKTIAAPVSPVAQSELSEPSEKIIRREREEWDDRLTASQSPEQRGPQSK